jgi:NADH-quinone oxidoreductase subunit J
VNPEAFLFWFLAIVTVCSGLAVVLMTNPVYAALSLAMTMVGVAAVFVTLNAYFLAGVQLIVYAGAVMVLFVMVLMLFDLKAEIQAFSRGKLSGFLKIGSVAMLGGLVIGAIVMSSNSLLGNNLPDLVVEDDGSKQLGKLLFSKYLFGFEALGVLLMVVAVGAVALARSKGGTHAKH